MPEIELRLTENSRDVYFVTYKYLGADAETDFRPKIEIEKVEMSHDGKPTCEVSYPGYFDDDTADHILDECQNHAAQPEND